MEEYAIYFKACPAFGSGPELSKVRWKRPHGSGAAHVLFRPSENLARTPRRLLLFLDPNSLGQLTLSKQKTVSHGVIGDLPSSAYHAGYANASPWHLAAVRARTMRRHRTWHTDVLVQSKGGQRGGGPVEKLHARLIIVAAAD